MGGKPVSLGPRILRTETAGLVVISITLYELGDLGVRI
ncbi:16S rRNA (uracil(1498)-N(3))-methyltransferase [Schnuerera ultunensis]